MPTGLGVGVMRGVEVSCVVFFSGSVQGGFRLVLELREVRKRV